MTDVYWAHEPLCYFPKSLEAHVIDSDCNAEMIYGQVANICFHRFADADCNCMSELFQLSLRTSYWLYHWTHAPSFYSTLLSTPCVILYLAADLKSCVATLLMSDSCVNLISVA